MYKQADAEAQSNYPTHLHFHQPLMTSSDQQLISAMTKPRQKGPLVYTHHSICIYKDYKTARPRLKFHFFRQCTQGV
ncbi:hypothetical protein Hanom_Chr05g00400581 [Helianthus anomalus]